jgi:hypothetical protein
MRFNQRFTRRGPDLLAHLVRPQMALLVPNNGEGDIASGFIGTTTNLTVPILCLYQSNTTPAETDTTATYTEATFTGYSNISLASGSWSVVEGAPTRASFAQQTFTSSAGSQNQSIYGYFLKRTTNGRIMLAERFTDGPYTIVNNGDQIKITPQVDFD